MHHASFKKGELFEKFVEEKLFKASAYDLLHRTNNYEQNQSRYAEDTLKPDLKFRCKKTTQEFWVEAKYRSGFNAEQKIKAISYVQIERFKVFQKQENIPIFIAIGYGGAPDNPADISLIPLNDLEYLELYPTFLKRFRIEKGLIDAASLNPPLKAPSEPTQKVQSEDSLKNTRSIHFKNKKTIVAAGIGFALVALLLFNLFNSPIEDILKQKTTEYYRTIQTGNIDALEDYISPNVDTWYSKSQITFAEIKKDTRAYMNRHPKTSTDIQWNTFEVTPLTDGYAVTYKMIYKLLSENKGKDIIYHLRIHAIWDKDLKIRSMYEEKI